MKDLHGIEHNLNDFDCICKKDGKRIAISSHAKSHMLFFDISPQTLCDMLSNPVPSNSKRGTPDRKKSGAKRLCSMRKKVKYNIILDPFIIGEEKCWVVSNMEPLK